MTMDDERVDARAALDCAAYLDRVVRRRHAAWYVRYLLLSALAALGTLIGAALRQIAAVATVPAVPTGERQPVSPRSTRVTDR